IPQFAAVGAQNVRLSQNLAPGLTLLAMGLFKKIWLADSLALFAAPLFRLTEDGGTLPIAWAWVAVVAYTFQIYFDFSGYSDMAIGTARCFGIGLPQNFDSPYKAVGIGDFWRRWHITLGAFLRDYIYIPLGGNRRGTSKTRINFMITMVLAGFWHGAGWNFLLWGAAHGILLVLDHGW